MTVRNYTYFITSSLVQPRSCFQNKIFRFISLLQSTKYKCKICKLWVLNSVETLTSSNRLGWKVQATLFFFVGTPDPTSGLNGGVRQQVPCVLRECARRRGLQSTNNPVLYRALDPALLGEGVRQQVPRALRECASRKKGGGGKRESALKVRHSLFSLLKISKHQKKLTQNTADQTKHKNLKDSKKKVKNVIIILLAMFSSYFLRAFYN